MVHRETDWLDEANKRWDRREYTLALEAFLQGQRYAGDSLGLVSNVAELLHTLRRGPEAMAILEAVRQVDPRYLPAHENFLTAGLSLDGCSPCAIAQRHFDWGLLYENPDPARRLRARPARMRLGYLSANFGLNPEGFFTLPFLEAHDHSRVEVFCYSNRVDDIWTPRFRKAADQWREIWGQPDELIAAQIERDSIDILVDLSGHFEGGRLPLFARSPAPIQISFPTYPATTGLPAIQYRITDRWTDEPGQTESLHSEKLIRLDRCYCCYAPPGDAPEVGPLPALRKGFVTFGVFNRAQKITDRMLRVWGTIVRETPGSRILFHHVYNGAQPVQPEFREPMLRVLAEAGVSADRVEFVGLRSPVDVHLAVFNQVDISLDTFPYHGMTTTCESFWMGVPVVTLAGGSHVSRVGVSLNASLGLERFTAATEEQYARIASEAAEDLESLARLRCSLREDMRRSPLTDARGYARSLEDAYEAMWECEFAKKLTA
jgi:predicted O-linked N-acetylglucosamine transferase (SPINDLY family)